MPQRVLLAAVLAIASGAKCAGAAPAPAPAPARADIHCLTDWSVAAQIVKKEKLVTVRQLMAHARSHMKGSVIKTTLCQIGDRYEYRLVVIEPGGIVRSHSVDAHKPLSQ